MLYKLLGMLVWNGGKVLMRKRYGAKMVPGPVIAGAVVLGGALVGLVLAKRES